MERLRGPPTHPAPRSELDRGAGQGFPVIAARHARRGQEDEEAVDGLADRPRRLPRGRPRRGGHQLGPGGHSSCLELTVRDGTRKGGHRSSLSKARTCQSLGVQIGVLGGTGPAGSAVSARLAAVGVEVLLGSRTQEKATEGGHELQRRWTGHALSLVPVTNQVAARADLVILATPVEGAVNTVRQLVDELSGKILVTMVN